MAWIDFDCAEESINIVVYKTVTALHASNGKEFFYKKKRNEKNKAAEEVSREYCTTTRKRIGSEMSNHRIESHRSTFRTVCSGMCVFFFLEDRNYESRLFVNGRTVY